MTPNSGHGEPGLRHNIHQHVQSLGDTPEAVAGHLVAHGVSGLPGRAGDCAVARYLQAVIGSETTVKRVMVMERTIRVRRTGWRLPLVVRLPGAVTSFVRSFDAGRFPDLIQARDAEREPASEGSGQPPVGLA